MASRSKQQSAVTRVSAIFIETFANICQKLARFGGNLFLIGQEYWIMCVVFVMDAVFAVNGTVFRCLVVGRQELKKK